MKEFKKKYLGVHYFMLEEKVYAVFNPLFYNGLRHERVKVKG